MSVLTRRTENLFPASNQLHSSLDREEDTMQERVALVIRRVIPSSLRETAQTTPNIRDKTAIVEFLRQYPDCSLTFLTAQANLLLQDSVFMTTPELVRHPEYPNLLRESMVSFHPEQVLTILKLFCSAPEFRDPESTIRMNTYRFLENLPTALFKFPPEVRTGIRKILEENNATEALQQNWFLVCPNIFQIYPDFKVNETSLLNALIPKPDQELELRKARARFFVSEKTGIHWICSPKQVIEHHFPELLLLTPCQLEHNDSIRGFFGSEDLTVLEEPFPAHAIVRTSPVSIEQRIRKKLEQGLNFSSEEWEEPEVRGFLQNRECVLKYLHEHPDAPNIKFLFPPEGSVHPLFADVFFMSSFILIQRPEYSQVLQKSPLKENLDFLENIFRLLLSDTRIEFFDKACELLKTLSQHFENQVFITRIQELFSFFWPDYGERTFLDIVR